MKIAILGVGAMGCLLGGKLSASADNEIFMIGSWKEAVDHIFVNGITIEENGQDNVYRPARATSDSSEVGPCDLVLVAVKSYSTGATVRKHPALFGPDTIALTMQNGVGNVEQIAECIGEDHVMAGTTSHGATVLAPGHVRHAGVGETVIGEIAGGCSERLEAVQALLNEAGFVTDLSDNVVGLVWDKLMVNVGINALTGITGLENGKLLERPDLEELMRLAVTEAAAVAEAKGIRLGPDPVEHARQVAEKTARNRSSMLQDISGGKKTEIETINGAIVREAEALGIEVPVNRVLTRLILGMERP